MRLIDADWVQVELGCAPYYKCNSGTMRQFGNGINKPVSFCERESLLKWKDILAVLDEAPTIEAEPVRHGRWDDEDNARWVCTLCGSWYIVDSNGYMHYCPHCGAKMDKKEEL